MPVIHLVRHGQASFGAENYDVLSDIGRAQATVVGAELARRAPRAPLLVCGTLRRQRDTLQLLAEAGEFEGELVSDARWNEYDHLALLHRHGSPPRSVTSVGEIQRALDGALLTWIEDEQNDGWREFSAGAKKALDRVVHALGAGQDAIVVTSGGVLAALCGRLLSLPASAVVAVNRVMLNAAVTTLLVGGSGVSLLTLNDHAHLSGDREGLRTYR